MAQPCDGCEHGGCECDGYNGWKVGGTATSRVCSVCDSPTSCGNFNDDRRWVCEDCCEEETVEEELAWLKAADPAAHAALLDRLK
jgi:hypothetical protein